MNKLCIYVVTLILVFVSCCKSKYGSLDFADAISQAQKIRLHFKVYQEKYNNDPTGIELRDFILSEEVEYGEIIIGGWLFHEKESPYIATKRCIRNQQGSYYDILILSSNDFKVIVSKCD